MGSQLFLYALWATNVCHLPSYLPAGQRVHIFVGQTGGLTWSWVLPPQPPPPFAMLIVEGVGGGRGSVIFGVNEMQPFTSIVRVAARRALLAKASLKAFAISLDLAFKSLTASMISASGSGFC